MTTTALKPVATIKSRVLIILLLSVVAVVLSPSVISGMVGLGGYISEKTLGDGTNENLYLGDGANEMIVVGVGPTVSTLPLATPSTSSGGVISATLRGNLDNLNGMPKADVWFVWGYSPAAMTNTTSAVSTTSTGLKVAVIHPDTAGVAVYYQFRASTDGTSVGGTESFFTGGLHGMSYWLMKDGLPIVIACVILVTVLAFTGNPIVALFAALIGLIGFYAIQALVSLF